MNGGRLLTRWRSTAGQPLIWRLGITLAFGLKKQASCYRVFMARWAAVKRLGMAVGLLGGTCAIVWAMWPRPTVPLAFHGQFLELSDVSDTLYLQAPAFFSPVERVFDRQAIGFVLGEPGSGQYIAVAVGRGDSSPFLEHPRFKEVIGDAYLQCLLSIVPGEGSYFWQLLLEHKAEKARPPIRAAVSQISVPLVSRVCIAGTGKNMDWSLQVFGSVTRATWRVFRKELEQMLDSIRLDTVMAAAHFPAPTSAGHNAKDDASPRRP